MTSRVQIPQITKGLRNSPLPQAQIEAETAAYVAAARARGANFTPGEIYAYNRWYKRMKAAGLLSRVQGAWCLIATDKAAIPINLITPGIRDLITVGSPTEIAQRGVSFSTGSYYDTGFSASILNDEDCHISVMSETASSNTTAAFGAQNSGGTVGYTIAPSEARVRLASSVATASSTGTADGLGLVLASRDSPANFRVDRNGQVLVAAQAGASSPLGAINLFIGTVNVNGTAGSATDKMISFASAGRAMTAAQSQQFYAITRSLWLALRYGCPDFHEAGAFPQAVEVDFLAYGATPGSIVAAYEAKRQGLSVAIVGGWRDRHLGGMMAGGLGHLDWNRMQLLGGLSNWVVNTSTRMNGEIRTSSNTVPRNAEPHIAEGVFRSMLDPRRKHGLDIPVYWSDGVDIVEKSGTVITSMTTVDGRTFTATTFHDGSYEGDLIARAGVRYRIGREAAGAGAGEALGGYQPLETLQVVIDPYVTPGSAGSGLIPWVNADDGRANGAADAAEYINRVEQSNSGYPVTTQPYNFRLTMTRDARRAAAPPSLPPAGYDIANYELYLRYWEARQANFGPMTFTGGRDGVVAEQGVLSKTIANGVAERGMLVDINATGQLSSDWIGQNWNYPEADYAERAAIWTAHREFTLGLIYLARHDPSARVPASLRADAETWSFANSEFLDPYDDTYGTDPLHFSYQLYVRSGRRIVGEVIITADHLKETLPIISTKTVGMTSYYLDSHVIQAVARSVSGGVVRVALEGGFFVQTGLGGSDIGTPMPVEIMVPKAAECTNLTSSFVVSATHVANGQIRMEAASMQLGQAAGVLGAIRSETGAALQSIDYEGVLRPRLFASRRWYDEDELVLTQTVG